MGKPGLQTQPPPGTKVRLTGYFLKATGQVVGGEGQKRWTVMPCACGLCRGPDSKFVAIDEKKAADDYYDDVPPEQRHKWRHVAIGNLQIIGAPPRAADQPEEVGNNFGRQSKRRPVKQPASALVGLVRDLNRLTK